MAEPKTKPTNQSVKEFLNEIPEPERRDGLFRGGENNGRDYGREAEDVGTEHRWLWYSSLQVCERTRRRLAHRRLLTAQERSDGVPHDGLRKKY